MRKLLETQHNNTESGWKRESKQINSKDIEPVIKKNLPSKKSPRQVGFTGVFYQTLKEILMPVPVKAFQNIKKKKILPNQFYKASITLMPKPQRKLLKNKLQDH